MEFTGFCGSDFDAYEEKKWASNVFNLERLQVKEKLEALGRLLAPRLHGLDGAPLSYEVNAEHPALWNHHRVEAQFLFFSRDGDARRELDTIIAKSRSLASLVEDPSPLRNHIILAVRVDARDVEVSLRLHADATVDRENVERIMGQFFAREKLLARINELPDTFEIAVEGMGTTHVARTLSDEAIQEVVATLAGSQSTLSIRRTWDRSDPVVAEARFGDLVGESLEALIPTFHAMAWSRDNDHLSMRETLKGKSRERVTKGLDKNDRVRIISGMLAGKTGVVQEANDKGEVKVAIGTLTLKVKSDALTKI